MAQERTVGRMVIRPIVGALLAVAVLALGPMAQPAQAGSEGGRTYRERMYGRTVEQKERIYESLSATKRSAVRAYMRNVSVDVAEAAHPRRAYDRLSRVQKSAVKDYSRATRASSDTGGSGSCQPRCTIVVESVVEGVTCWTFQPAQVAYRNLLGEPLFWYRMRMDWCQDGVNIVQRAESSEPWADMSTLPFWTFENRTWQQTGGIGQPYYRVFQQGRFKWCITQFGCAFEVAPWMRATGNGDGTWDFEWGGGW